VTVLVVGAGLTGATIARVLAEAGQHVEVLDKRSHVAGNAYDFQMEGVNVHKYGPHIFHTSNQTVVDFLSRFTTWIPYEHRVKALIQRKGLLEDRDQYVPFPPNYDTIAALGLKDEKDVIELFYRPYTEKMWGMPLEKVNPNILKRVPIREDFEDRYFPNDTFQAMPEKGYTAMVENILGHKNIKVFLDHRVIDNDRLWYDYTFWSGTIDGFHNCALGALPYRSIRFEMRTLTEDLPATTVNFTDKGPYTRITQWTKLPGPHMDPSKKFATIEMPTSFGTPYYPVPDVDGKNRELYEKYAAIPTENVTFCGRLGKYAYINMDQAVSSALAVARKFLDEAR
jgi:UDP-galactopyranose mutase